MAAPRILFFAPYANWLYHTGLETSWLHALRLRGATVAYSTCQGMFPVCGIYKLATNPRPPDGCQHCRTRVEDMIRVMSLPDLPLDRFVTAADKVAVKVWAAAIAPQDLLQAEYDGQPVGSWAASSAHTQVRMNKLRLELPAVREMVRGQVEGAALASIGVGRLLDTWKPDTVTLLNGRFFAHWAMIEHCKQRGIRFVTHERGLRKNTIRFAENARTHDLSPLHTLWDQWKDIALDESDLAHAREVILDRRYGRNYSWLSFSPPPQGVDKLRADLNLSTLRPVVAVFGSSDDETAAFKERRAGAFPDAFDFLPAVCTAAMQMPDVDFVIRMHPNLKSVVGTNHQGIQQALAVKAAGLQNVRVVMPRDDVSTYTLVDLADVVVAYASTVGLESAVFGKPVLVAAQATYSHSGCTEQIESAGQLAAQVQEAIARGTRRDVARTALRWTARYFREYAIPYAPVHEEPQHFPRLNFQGVRELAPGKDAVLDGVCRLLMGTGTVLARPTDADRARTTEAEDTFLDEWLARPAGETA